MPYIKSNDKLREIIKAYTVANNITPEMVFQESGCLELGRFYFGREDFVHEDTIANFTHWLFPIDYEKE